MTQEQTALLLKAINELYPGRLKVEKSTVSIWHMVMGSQDYDEVIRRLGNYAKANRFAPSANDLFERPRPEADRSVLDEIDEWEAKAGGAPVQR
ncbi:replicative helicase loader/inhibitor [Alteribacter natronophilus]|uniref:replicative helicase loader/inhibitor n=1 Tax=Alteribacter natronophilus TaxID=2583810 RepID=UPI00110EB047|nr:replicative helicase loader/inhibitor [Alteribacter natronophilus]TMW72770.1 hypothetical protein FGB90_00205 [Alteribacter natronophilus]